MTSKISKIKFSFESYRDTVRDLLQGRVRVFFDELEVSNLEDYLSLFVPHLIEQTLTLEPNKTNRAQHYDGASFIELTRSNDYVHIGLGGFNPEPGKTDAYIYHQNAFEWKQFVKSLFSASQEFLEWITQHHPNYKRLARLNEDISKLDGLI